MSEVSTKEELGAMFVAAAFVEEFNMALADAVYDLIGQHRESGGSDGHFRLEAVSNIAAVQASVASYFSGHPCRAREQLEVLLDSVRRQFTVADDTSAIGRALSDEALESALAVASSKAEATLKEVLAGFPVSGGHWRVWKTQLEAL